MNDFKDLRKKNIEKAKEKVKDSFSKDLMIINSINNIEELDKTINNFASRLREWFGIVNPELTKKVDDNEKFIQIVLEYEGTPTKMGAKVDADDDRAIKSMAAAGQALVQTKTFQMLYLEKIMNDYCKNLFTLAGANIGAKLLREAGSLKRLASLQSSTVQLLGAEKALFRHIKTGAKSPKYGYIVNHPLVMDASKENKGKAARVLADKLSICARLDFFDGEFMGDKFLKELSAKWKK